MSTMDALILYKRIKDNSRAFINVQGLKSKNSKHVKSLENSIKK